MVSITVFFFGVLILESLLGMIVFVSLILAAIIHTFMSQESRMEELELKIQNLENNKQ